MSDSDLKKMKQKLAILSLFSMFNPGVQAGGDYVDGGDHAVGNWVKKDGGWTNIEKKNENGSRDGVKMPTQEIYFNDSDYAKCHSKAEISVKAEGDVPGVGKANTEVKAGYSKEHNCESGINEFGSVGCGNDRKNLLPSEEVVKDNPIEAINPADLCSNVVDDYVDSYSRPLTQAEYFHQYGYPNTTAEREIFRDYMSRNNSEYQHQLKMEEELRMQNFRMQFLPMFRGFGGGW